jgi:hypothetical protein
MPDDRDFDALLDQALAGYVDAEPGPFLRARIMAAAAEPHRRWPVWTFAGVAACTAALALTLFLPHLKEAPPAANTTAAAPSFTPARPSSQTVPPVQQAHSVRTAHRARHIENAALEHSRFHAADDALTEEDRILLKFIAEHPKEARQALMPPPNQPVEIKPITVQPIQVAGLSEFGESKNSSQPFEK